MNKGEQNRCLKRRRKKTVRRWKAIRKRNQRERKRRKGKKGRYFALAFTFVCISLGTASKKGWKARESAAEISTDRLPALLEFCPFYEEELCSEEKAVSRTEQGVSLFLKEGRIVFFRIREEPCDN